MVDADVPDETLPPKEKDSVSPQSADRILESETTTSYSYIYASGKLLQEKVTTNGTTETHNFFYDNTGKPYAMQVNGTTYYYVTNLQGDVMGMVDASGNSVASYTYDPYGKPLTATGELAEKNPLRYRGYYYDSESGLYYLQSRYYDPATRRFVNADAYASTGQGIIGTNMFAYCCNNAVNKADSDGQMAIAGTVAATNFWNPVGWAAALVLAIGVATVVIATYKSAEETAEIVKATVETAKEPEEMRDQSVYILVDPHDDNKVKYVGRTNNPTRRRHEHLRNPSKAGYVMHVVFTELTLDEAKVYEQALISAYTLEYLDNARREIAVGNLHGYRKSICAVAQLFDGVVEDELLNLMGR